MTFVGSNSVLGGGYTSVHKILVYVQATTNGVNDFEHNTVLSYVFEKTGIDWQLTEKRVVSLSKDKSTGFLVPQICAWKSRRYT